MVKSYLKLQMLLLIAFLGVLGLFNYWADPYERFKDKPRNDSGTIVQFPSRRAWLNITFQRIVEGDCDTIFLGNSRTWRGLDPARVAKQVKAYNASISNCNFEDMYTLLHLILEKKKIATLVLGLDFSMERTPNDFPHEGLGPTGLPQSLLGFQTAKDGTIMLIGKHIKHKTTRILPNGYLTAPTGPKTPRAHRNYLNRLLATLDKSTHLPLSQRKGWPYLHAIVRECRNRDIDLILFFSPVHAEILEGIVRSGRYEEFETWMRMVVAIAHGQAPEDQNRRKVRTWQFCGYNSITTDPLPRLTGENQMRWYFEASHYRKAVGDLILDRIFGNANTAIPPNFGVLITPGNLDARLEQLRLEREAYLEFKQPSMQ